MRVLSADHPSYEAKGAEVRVARRARPCDVYGCDAMIAAGDEYAYINTGIAWCRQHFDAAHIIERTK